MKRKVMRNIYMILTIIYVLIMLNFLLWGLHNESFVINLITFIELPVLLFSVSLINLKTEKKAHLSVGIIVLLCCFGFFKYITNFYGMYKTNIEYGSEKQKVRLLLRQDGGWSDSIVINEKETLFGYKTRKTLIWDTEYKIDYDLEKIYNEEM